MSAMKLKINGKTVEAAEGSTILSAARENGISIPTLCYLEGINEIGACRLCVVEIKGLSAPRPACVTAAEEGMEIETDTPALRLHRRAALERICAEHVKECTECPKGFSCTLQELCKE